MSSSHDSSEPIERKGSAAKRISHLNGHEEHILRRKINAYQKIHNKEIAEVSSQLEEIRESMKALATDPLYGTHALISKGVDQRSPYRRSATEQGRKSKLRRTQSFPELVDESNSGTSGADHSPFPGLKGELQKAARVAVKSGEKTAFNDLIKSSSKSIRSHYVHRDSAPFGKEATEGKEQGHKKLERSKTAPVAMLQPLLKTTPEMMRKKIHISTSNRHSTEEVSSRRGLSPRFGDGSSRNNPTYLQQTETDLGTLLHRQHRPKIVPDSQHMGNLKLTSHSVNESKISKLGVKDVSAKKVSAKAEKNDVFVSLHSEEPGNKSPKGISKPFFKFKEDLFEASNEGSDNEKGDDLRSCRYLRFAKESQESNRI